MGMKEMEQWLQMEKVDPNSQFATLVRSIYSQESGAGKNTGKSNAGATGHMQLMPGTFAANSDKGWDINNPEHNARAGIRYLGEMFKLAKGDPYLAAVGYYGGPGGMQKARQGIAVYNPRPEGKNDPNTLQYAQQIMNRMQGAKGGTPVAPAPVNDNPMKAMAVVDKVVPYVGLANKNIQGPVEENLPNVAAPAPVENPYLALVQEKNLRDQASEDAQRFQAAYRQSQEQDVWQQFQDKSNEVEALKSYIAQQQEQQQQTMNPIPVMQFATPVIDTRPNFGPFQSFSRWGRNRA